MQCIKSQDVLRKKMAEDMLPIIEYAATNVSELCTEVARLSDELVKSETRVIQLERELANLKQLTAHMEMVKYEFPCGCEVRIGDTRKIFHGQDCKKRTPRPRMR